MNVNIRLPNITGHSDKEKLQQVQSYMYQLVEQLNYALSAVEKEAAEVAQTTAAASKAEDDPQTSFNAIKALIIKSADIVNAYYDTISTKLDGLYVAESDFGVFVEQTNGDIEATSTAVEQLYTNLQQVITDINTVENTLIAVNAHIKSGLLYYDENGVPVYGLEIGQRSAVDGVETFNKYARFTSDKLSFYDQNDNEVAYVSDKKLYITIVEVTGSFIMGGFVDTVLADRSVVTKWIG